jgi:hypothetical protein
MNPHGIASGDGHAVVVSDSVDSRLLILDRRLRADELGPRTPGPSLVLRKQDEEPADLLQRPERLIDAGGQAVVTGLVSVLEPGVIQRPVRTRRAR